MQMMLYLIFGKMKMENIKKFDIEINTIEDEEVKILPEKSFQQVSCSVSAYKTVIFKDMIIKKPQTDLEL